MRVHRETVLVGMSGGVDSSVAALLLKKKGYKVIGAFMKNYSDRKDPTSGECHWREEWRMAQRVAGMLNIPIVMIDSEREYKRSVIDCMYKDYASGLTPNPDILCNRVIKFPFLWKKARSLGADFIATGHYARVQHGTKEYELLRGADNDKDQSYFLYELTQKDLRHTLFPLGGYRKDGIRALARKNGFPNWNKQGTRGICFIGKMDMKAFLKKRIKKKKGDVMSPRGEIIGTHPGSVFFTIGERVGEGKEFVFNEKAELWRKRRLYVAAKKRGNVLVVVPEGDSLLKGKKVFVRKFLFVAHNAQIYSRRLRGRIRHRGVLHYGSLTRRKGRFVFHFKKPVWGIAEGQALVIYDGERVVGGGEMRLR